MKLLSQKGSGSSYGNSSRREELPSTPCIRLVATRVEAIATRLVTASRNSTLLALLLRFYTLSKSRTGKRELSRVQ